jgi:hypothetical protein
MNIHHTELFVSGCLLAAVFAGVRLRRLLPDHHLNDDSRDAIKLAMGLVATLAALVLGLLVSSAKNSYDTKRNEVVQLGAKVAFLDRVLALYGSEAAETRVQFHNDVREAVNHMWPKDAGAQRQFESNHLTGEALYSAIQNLSPRDDTQRGLKTQAASLVLELGELQSVLVAQAGATIYKPLLIAMVCWLVVVFLGFGLLAPPNATTTVALLAAMFSVAMAVFLILELEQPMSGLIPISSAPILNALAQ